MNFIAYMHSTAVVVGFEEASYFVGESALILSYHLHIWGWLERDVTVYITTNNGSAIRKLEFDSSGLSLTIPSPPLLLKSYV